MCFTKLFRKKKIQQNVVNNQPQQSSKPNYKSQTFTFKSLPTSLEEFKELPEANLSNPFKTAALTLVALCVYTKDVKVALQMLNFLRGPRPMSPMDEQFIRDRFMDKGKYIPFSYFKGAKPENNYVPNEPFTITISEYSESYKDPDYASLSLVSSGADNTRHIKLRKKGSGEWFLWEQSVMVGIRDAKETDPWA